MEGAKRKKPIHRAYYRPARRGEKREDIQPLVKADPVITTEGVKLDFMLPRERLTPEGLQMLARWLYSLSHEARDIAASGLISPTQAYDTQATRTVPINSSSSELEPIE